MENSNFQFWSSSLLDISLDSFSNDIFQEFDKKRTNQDLKLNMESLQEQPTETIVETTEDLIENEMSESPITSSSITLPSPIKSEVEIETFPEPIEEEIKDQVEQDEEINEKDEVIERPISILSRQISIKSKVESITKPKSIDDRPVMTLNPVIESDPPTKPAPKRRFFFSFRFC